MLDKFQQKIDSEKFQAATTPEIPHSAYRTISSIINPENVSWSNDNYVSSGRVRAIIEDYQEIDGNKPKVSKYVAKRLHDSLGVKLSGEQKSLIGNILSKRESSYQFDMWITSGCEGTARDYYHGGSCWWGGYSQSKAVLTGNNGGAIRTFNHCGDMSSRTWYLPHNDGILLFNAYGIDLDYIANAVANTLGCSYTTVWIDNLDFTQDSMYYNTRRWALIHEQDYVVHNVDNFPVSLPVSASIEDYEDSENLVWIDSIQSYRHIEDDNVCYCEQCEEYDVYENMTTVQTCDGYRDEMIVCENCLEYVCEYDEIAETYFNTETISSIETIEGTTIGYELHDDIISIELGSYEGEYTLDDSLVVYVESEGLYIHKDDCAEYGYSVCSGCNSAEIENTMLLTNNGYECQACQNKKLADNGLQQNMLPFNTFAKIQRTESGHIAIGKTIAATLVEMNNFYDYHEGGLLVSPYELKDILAPYVANISSMTIRLNCNMFCANLSGDFYTMPSQYIKDYASV